MAAGVAKRRSKIRKRRLTSEQNTTSMSDKPVKKSGNQKNDPKPSTRKSRLKTTGGKANGAGK